MCGVSKAGWWQYLPLTGWEPFEGKWSLDQMYEVEDRLNNEQWAQYEETLCKVGIDKWRSAREIVHFKPGQKVRALAAVLREHVKGANP